MGLFKKRTKETEVREVTPVVNDVLLKALLNGETITRDKAMTVPAVNGAVGLICNLIASMPVKLYKQRQDKVEEKRGDVRVKMLNSDTGDTLNGYELKRAMVEDYLLSGGGFCYIEKRLNEVTGLYYVSSRNISILKNEKPIFKNYTVMVDGENFYPFDFVKLLRNTKDGSTGTSITSEVSKALETAYSTLVYQLGLVKSGGNKKGFLKAGRKLGQEEIDTLKTAWKNLYQNNENNCVVLNSGIEFQESSNSSVEMQLNESKKTLQDEINAIFHIYPDNFTLTFKEAIFPIVKAFEAALNRDLLLEKEKKNMFFEFDTKEITKADLTERYNAYKTAKETGFLTLNEIRRAENLNYIDGLDVVNVGLSAVLYDVNSHTYYTPNTNTAQDLTLDNSADIGDNERYNKNHDGKTGRFTSGKGVSGGGINSGKSKYAKMPKAKMSAREKEIVSHAIATDFPKLKEGINVHRYEYGDYCYYFSVNNIDSYNFHKKRKLK